MIKSLFGDDEDQVEAEDSLIPKNIETSRDGEENSKDAETPSASASKSKDVPTNPEQVVPFEVEKPIGSPKKPALNTEETELEKQIAAIEADLKKSGPVNETDIGKEVDNKSPKVPDQGPQTEVIREKLSGSPDIFGKDEDDKVPDKILDFTPDSPVETLRKTGLAYSAAIALFGSVVFMLIIGWLADLFLGIQPWGTVIGIVIGAIIGFMQFFRITSRIINPNRDDFARVSIKSQEPDITPADSDGDSSKDGEA